MHEITDIQMLRKIVKVVPSLKIKVHYGGDYESNKCIATVTVEHGVVTVGNPEVEFVSGTSQDEFTGRLVTHLVQ